MPAPLRSVVALGGSAGALPVVLRQVDRLIAPDHSCLFIIYHRAGTRPFNLQAFLPEGSPFRAVEARDGMALEPNHVYHPHRSDDLLVREGRLVVAPSAVRPRPNIDRLLTSLARAYGRRVVAGLLSGLGRDGVEGLRAVAAAGGHTMVQDPAEAAFAQLPANAIAAGVAGEVLRTSAMVAHIAHFLEGAAPAPSPAKAPRSAAMAPGRGARRGPGARRGKP